MLAIIIGLAVVLFVVVLRLVTVVREGDAYVVERLGRFHRILPAGMHFLAPATDRIAFRFSLLPKDQQVSDTAITHDNVPVRVTSVCRWQIGNVERAAYATADLAGHVTALVRNAQRDRIAERSYDDVRESRREVEAAIERSVAEGAEQAGAKIVSVTIGNVERA